MTEHIKITQEFVDLIIESEIDPLEEKLKMGVNYGTDKKRKQAFSKKPNVKASDKNTLIKAPRHPEDPSVGRGKASVTPVQKKQRADQKSAMDAAEKKANAARAAKSMAEEEENTEKTTGSPLRDKAIKLLGKDKGNAKADHYKKLKAKLNGKPGSGLGTNGGKIG